MSWIANPSRVIACTAIVGLALTGCTRKNDSAGSSGDSGGGGGKKVSVAFVPKLQGIPYFEAMNTGGKKAAEELGITWQYQGPTTADAAQQAQIVRSFIQKKVDVLAVAPNDPDSMAPVLKEAKAAGIKVMTTDTDAPSSVRELFVNQATAKGLGTTVVEQLMKANGGKGEVAIVSCGQTAENLNSWIKVEKKLIKEKYPKVKVVDTVYAGEDEAKSISMAKNLMNAHPKLTGLIGECTPSAPGVAKAVQEAGKIGKIFTVGVGTPQSMKPYLDNGSSSASVLWNVENLGYLTAWAGQQLADGKKFSPSNDVGDGMKEVKYTASDKSLLLGDPLVITKKNVNQFNY